LAISSQSAVRISNRSNLRSKSVMACPPDPVKQEDYAFGLHHGEHHYAVEPILACVPVEQPAGDHAEGIAAAAT
jgi:hypothetical protein